MKSMGFVFCAAIAFTPVGALADRGQGSIRAAGRSAPPPPARAPAHAEPAHSEPAHAEPAHGEPPHGEPPHGEPPHGEPAHAQPDAHRDDHAGDHASPPARVDENARRDWDDNDENRQHFGGYGQSAPAHVFRGQHIHELPHTHFAIVFSNQNFFYDDVGAYYQQQSDGDYVVVQPPVGAVIPSLPPDITPIVVGPTTYYYLDGVFYIDQNGAFAIVNPPPGIVVPNLPSEATMVVNNGNVYYQFNGFNYQPSIQDGVTVYTVNPM